MKKKVFIEGLSCGHCVNHVKEALSELNGVTDVDVYLKDKYAILDSNTDIDDKVIQDAIDDAGYEAIKIEVL